MATSLPYSVTFGDLLEAQEELILQQNCCVACKAHGLSQTIAIRFPYADPYAKRRRHLGRNFAIPEDQGVPGTISVYKCTGRPTFVSMFSQYGMGRPYSYNNSNHMFQDGANDRLRWFKECLSCVAKLQPASVAMPFQIGCGLAGGNWVLYERAISEWADCNPNIRVVLYRIK